MKGFADDATRTSRHARRGLLFVLLGAVVPLLALGIGIEHFVFDSGGAYGLPPGATRLPPLLLAVGLSLLCLLGLIPVVRSALEHQSRLVSVDAVTGLPNRRLYRSRLEQALRHASQDGSLVATGVVDLDGFKRINDTQGHAAGDELLRQVGDRLVNSLRLVDTVGHVSGQAGLARQGGDEFTFVLTRVRAQEDVGRVAERILHSLEAPFQVRSREIFVTASVGVAIYPHDGADATTLLRSADQALYCAKDLGRNNFQFFSAAMNESMQRKATLEASMRRALENREFRVAFQPVRHATEGTLTGAEALLRWTDDRGELIPPEVFIPVAEETGLIHPLGQWVLERSCMQAQRWREIGLAPIRLAVNVSGHQIRRPGFAEWVMEVLERTGVSPAEIDLEITESTIMQDDEATNDTIRRLHEHGIGLVLDDFGTGYSSLSYLKRFPVSRIKVDQSFIHDLETSSQDRALTGAIIAMAHGLGLEVIAECVETLEQIQLLRGLHCDELQGFLLGKPMMPEDFEALLASEKGPGEAGDD